MHCPANRALSGDDSSWAGSAPTITVVCRDRSPLYADSIRPGALDALQMVDAFHLVNDLREVLEAFLVNQWPALQVAAEHMVQALIPPAGPVPALTGEV